MPPAPGAPTPPAPAVALPPVAPAEPLSAEQQLVADAIIERNSERNSLYVRLAPYLTMLPPEERGIEVAAAMSMTRADRTEAVDAASPASSRGGVSPSRSSLRAPAPPEARGNGCGSPR